MSAPLPTAISRDQANALQNSCLQAMGGGYCPYSRFPVGCSLLVELPEGVSKQDITGLINAQACPGNNNLVLLMGANIENAAYPVGNCAEKVTLGYAVFYLNSIMTSQRLPIPPNLPSGLPWVARHFKALAVSTESLGRLPSSPCGSCRQFISEFCEPNMPILMIGKDATQWTDIKELLPYSFGPGNFEATDN